MDAPLISVAGIIGLLAIVAKLIDFARLLTNFGTQKSAIVTQVLTWAAGIVVVLLYASSQLGDFAIPGTQLLLSDANVATLIIVGLGVGSAASLAVDVKQALDNSDSAGKPPLLK